MAGHVFSNVQATVDGLWKDNLKVDFTVVLESVEETGVTVHAVEGKYLLEGTLQQIVEASGKLSAFERGLKLISRPEIANLKCVKSSNREAESPDDLKESDQPWHDFQEATYSPERVTPIISAKQCLKDGEISHDPLVTTVEEATSELRNSACGKETDEQHSEFAVPTREMIADRIMWDYVEVVYKHLVDGVRELGVSLQRIDDGDITTVIVSPANDYDHQYFDLSVLNAAYDQLANISLRSGSCVVERCKSQLDRKYAQPLIDKVNQSFKDMLAKYYQEVDEFVFVGPSNTAYRAKEYFLELEHRERHQRLAAQTDRRQPFARGRRDQEDDGCFDDDADYQASRVAWNCVIAAPISRKTVEAPCPVLRNSGRGLIHTPCDAPSSLGSTRDCQCACDCRSHILSDGDFRGLGAEPISCDVTDNWGVLSGGSSLARHKKDFNAQLGSPDWELVEFGDRVDGKHAIENVDQKRGTERRSYAVAARSEFDVGHQIKDAPASTVMEREQSVVTADCNPVAKRTRPAANVFSGGLDSESVKAEDTSNINSRLVYSRMGPMPGSTGATARRSARIDAGGITYDVDRRGTEIDFVADVTSPVDFGRKPKVTLTRRSLPKAEPEAAATEEESTLNVAAARSSSPDIECYPVVADSQVHRTKLDDAACVKAAQKTQTWKPRKKMQYDSSSDDDTTRDLRTERPSVVTTKKQGQSLPKARRSAMAKRLSVNSTVGNGNRRSRVRQGSDENSPVAVYDEAAVIVGRVGKSISVEDCYKAHILNDVVAAKADPVLENDSADEVEP